MKKLAYLLTFILILSMFAGCADGAPASQGSAAAGDTAQSDAADGPAVNRDVTIRILIPHVPFDVKTDNAVAELEKHLGFQVEFDTLPEKNAMDKLNLIFSSGKVDYDYIRLDADEIAKSLFVTYAKKGLLADLTEDIKQYENLLKIDGPAYEALTYDGKLYGIPNTGLPYAASTSAIRMDWLEKVGMNIPTDKDSLYAVLKAFQEQDPGGLGSNNIAFSAVPEAINAPIAQCFGFIFDYELKDKLIIDTRLQPEYKEYLTFMNKLYEEGILDADMPVNTGSKVTEKAASGSVGFYTGGTDQARDHLIAMHNEGNDGEYFRIIAPFKDQNGKQRAPSFEGMFTIGLIPKSCENVNSVLTYLDSYLSEDVFEKLIHGEEGVDYQIEDGERVPILPDFDKNRGNMYALYPVQYGEQYFPLWKLRTRKTPEAGLFFSQVFEEAGDCLDVKPLAFAPSFDTVSEKVKLVQEYAEQEATKFIAGARSLDEFDAFVQEMNDRGASEIVAEYNTWYAENN